MQEVCLWRAWRVASASSWVHVALCCVCAAALGVSACADSGMTGVGGAGQEAFGDVADSGQGSGDDEQAQDVMADDAALQERDEGVEDGSADDAGQADAVEMSDASDDELGEEPDEAPPQWWGEPVEAPSREWTWVDVPGTQCADGSPTGMGVNLNPGADKVFLYMEGGGACWNWDTCFGPVATALHLDGFDERTFDGLIVDVYLNSLIFNRDDVRNPFADAHFVFLPYCTADVFGGDNVVELEGFWPWQRETIHFVGRSNLDAYLARLVPTFQDVDKVVLSGSSAGGFGAGLSWPRVQAAFDEVRVDVLDDSGPPVEPRDGLWQEFQEVWQLEVPQDCPDCAESLASMREYLLDTMLPGRRFGLMSFRRDTVIATFFGILPLLLEERLDNVCDDVQAREGVECFLVDGRLHTLLLLGVEDTAAASGMPLWRWMEMMVEDDPEWESEF